MSARYCPTCEDELNSVGEEMWECPTCSEVYHAEEVPEAEPDDEYFDYDYDDEPEDDEGDD